MQYDPVKHLADLLSVLLYHGIYFAGPKVACPGISAPTVYIDGEVFPLPPPPYITMRLDGEAVLFAHTIMRHDIDRDFLYVLGGDGSSGAASISRIELMDGAEWEELCALSVALYATPYHMFATSGSALLIVGTPSAGRYTVPTYFVELTAGAAYPVEGPYIHGFTWCAVLDGDVISRSIGSSRCGAFFTKWRLPGTGQGCIVADDPFWETTASPGDTAVGCRTHVCCYNASDNRIHTYDGKVWNVLDYHPPENTSIVLFGHPRSGEVHLFAVSMSEVVDQVVIRPAKKTVEKTYHDIPADWLTDRTFVMF